MPEIFKSVAEATDLLKAGSVGVLPTDTLYGLVCRARSEPSVKKLYDLKERSGKPGTLIAANIEQLVDLGIKYRYLKAVEQYWPGAVSVVVPFSDFSKSYLHLGKLSLAVRIPDDKKLQKLLEKTGPLLTSSANVTGETPAANIAEAQQIFNDKVDFYVDGEDYSNHSPSTVIRIIDDEVEVLRQGAVKI